MDGLARGRPGMVHAQVTLWGDGERWTARGIYATINPSLKLQGHRCGGGRVLLGPGPQSEALLPRPNAGGCCPMGVAARSGSLHRGY